MRRWGIPPPSRKPCARTAFSCPLLSTGGDRVMLGRPGIMGISFWNDDFDFAHRDHGQKPNEHQEERGKNSEGADKRPDIDPGGMEQSPGRREKVAMQSA